MSRVSEEKDESVQRLREEQQTFERKIQQLEQQNVLIIQEREGILSIWTNLSVCSLLLLWYWLDIIFKTLKPQNSRFLFITLNHSNLNNCLVKPMVRTESVLVLYHP